MKGVKQEVFRDGKSKGIMGFLIGMTHIEIEICLAPMSSKIHFYYLRLLERVKPKKNYFFLATL